MACDGPLFVILCLVSVVPVRPDVDLRDYLRHKERIRQFPCSVPRPSVVAVMRISHGWAVVDPWETMLHRCDKSGCCPLAKTCKSSAEELVELSFLLRNVRTHDTRLERITFRNHTKCVCVSTHRPR
uniref:Platelet-derived growth factor (PDGF) family profile domain-containing protein n=1 Tax=Graphocephala atropunctata TaxID=36148 RepID=A0A1B6M5J2_9HEMI